MGIDPRNDQAVLIAKHFGSTNFVWNYFLEQRVREYKENDKFLTAFDMMKCLTALKNKYAWLSEVNAQSLQQTLMKLYSTFRSFFKHNTAFPKFKSKKDKQYFIVPQHFKFKGNRLILPNLIKA
ncbi:transposase [Thermoplasma volcanium GSS1]|uniref:Transposase n=1 Tax=Thermoplasma volcanium (strain ATCC 51530 / DSM 4299 / JCM 9571 / NBRC 15438 / GSS1) TaxID=273116 RepID=Q97AU7_THEVO|nr:transposase [Thermoplasma volcanium GSS1]